MKVAIYTRLSKEDENKTDANADSESIQNQKSMLINYALSQGWDIYQIYSDDDYAGSDRQRPQWNMMLDDARKRKFNIILCKSQSRFSREMEIVEKYINGLFLEWNIRFVGLADNADTANAGNKKSRQINGLVNEWYLEDLSANIKTVFKNKAHRGEFIGAFVVYGYKKDPANHNHLVIDEPAAEIVRRIFTLYQQGYGSTKIAYMLNDEHIPNPAKYKTDRGDRINIARKTSERWDLWTQSTVVYILTNQVYTGALIQHRFEKVSFKSKKQRHIDPENWIIVPDTHEAIIPQEEWENVQQQMKERGRPYKDGMVHIFAGKVYCASCKKKLQSYHGRNKVKYLICKTHVVSAEACPGTTIRISELESIVLEKIQELSGEMFEADYVGDRIYVSEHAEQEQKDLKKAIEKSEKTIAENTAYLKNLYMDKVKGVIPEDLFDTLLNQFKREKSGAETRLEALQARYDKLSQRQSREDQVKSIVEKYRDVTALTREMVLELIDFIEISPRVRYQKELPTITIYWNF